MAHEFIYTCHRLARHYPPDRTVSIGLDVPTDELYGDRRPSADVSSGDVVVGSLIFGVYSASRMLAVWLLGIATRHSYDRDVSLYIGERRPLAELWCRYLAVLMAISGLVWSV